MAKKGDSGCACLLNLRRLYAVNEPDTLYAFARTREHYETRNKVRTERTGEAGCPGPLSRR